MRLTDAKMKYSVGDPRNSPSALKIFLTKIIFDSTRGVLSTQALLTLSLTRGTLIKRTFPPRVKSP